MKLIKQDTSNKLNTQLTFTASEKEILLKRDKYLEKDIKDMIQYWAEFLASVEKGYTLTIDDYTNDIYNRYLLEEEIVKLPKLIGDKARNIIEPMDEEFKKLTNPIKESLWSEKDAAWWWYRIPKKLIGELKKGVESQNIHLLNQ